jgi:hypothetical protein
MKIYRKTSKRTDTAFHPAKLTPVAKLKFGRRPPNSSLSFGFFAEIPISSSLK